MTGVPAGIDTTTSRPEPRASRKSIIAASRTMQMNRIDRVVGGLGGHHLEVVHLKEFLERAANTVIVFDQQDQR